jgi:outer membrane immunogenic protein
VTSSPTRTGWVVGGGLEYALTRSWSIKGEYLYADFGSVTAVGPPITTAFPAVTSYTHHFSESLARAGVNYKFDWTAPPMAGRY